MYDLSKLLQLSVVVPNVNWDVLKPLSENLMCRSIDWFLYGATLAFNWLRI